jgi:uncharacterized damage-inducible protein DinB
MLDYFRQVLIGQFEAALCMLHDCIDQCPPEQWDATIGSLTFRQVSYHTLFFVDLYLSAGEDAFALRELHQRGGDERNPYPSAGVSKAETLAYLGICREKMKATLAAETRESLESPCGFSWRKDISRGELHFYNLRHVQHHTGQLSAHLRRIDKAFLDAKALRWVGTGWRSPA